MDSMNMTSIFEKMTEEDKEYRHNAMSYLFSELNKESFQPDQELALKLANIVLEKLEDASEDVSVLSVKCLVPLMEKVGEERIVEMTNKLCDKLLNGKDKQRDSASIALSFILLEVTTTSVAENILLALAPQIFKGFTGETSAEVKCECLEILGDVVNRFGDCDFVTKYHAPILTALLSQLNTNQARVRDETVLCIASLAPCLSDDLLAKATLHIVSLLKNKSTESKMTRTNVQMILALSLSVGHRFGPHVGEAVPLLINYCTSAFEELYEYSLQALESFMLSCPTDITPYCDGILKLALQYVSYDPNFTDSMDEGTDDEGRDEEDDDEWANACADDEDASWKVRRASAKCLSAIVMAYPQMLPKMYQAACGMLIVRFRERNENVKMDIFNTFIELLRQTGKVTKGQSHNNESSPGWLLKQEVPNVVKSINRQLRGKSTRTKVAAFSVLKELVVVLPNCLADLFGSLVPGIEKALDDKSSTSNLKIEVLEFLKIVLASHSPSVFQPYIQSDKHAIAGILDCALKGQNNAEMTTPASSKNKIRNEEKMCTPSNGNGRAKFKPSSESTKHTILTPTVPPDKTRNALSTGYKCRKSGIEADELGYTAMRMSKEELDAKGQRTPQRTGEPECKRKLYLGGSSSYDPALTGLESMEGTSPSIEKMNLQDYARTEKLSKLCAVPECPKILRLSCPIPKVLYLRSFEQLASVHRRNKTLAGNFNATNFVISLADNSVTLEILDELPYSKENGDKDYETFARVIEGLYDQRPCPTDVSKWLEVISKGVDFWHPKLIVNHIVMLDDAAAFGAFQSMYHSFLEFELDHPTEFSNMVCSKVMEKHNNWHEESCKCDLLLQTYFWEDPVTKRRSSYKKNVKGLLKLVRDCWEHKAKFMQSSLLCILLATHPDVLPDTQKALWDAGYLKHLNTGRQTRVSEQAIYLKQLSGMTVQTDS